MKCIKVLYFPLYIVRDIWAHSNYTIYTSLLNIKIFCLSSLYLLLVKSAFLRLSFNHFLMSIFHEHITINEVTQTTSKVYFIKSKELE